MRQIRDEFIAAHPDPSDPVAHTLSVYADEPDDAFVIIASGNVYGDGVKTGLTWGDLRRLSAAASDDRPTCPICGRRFDGEHGPVCDRCHATDDASEPTS